MTTPERAAWVTLTAVGLFSVAFMAARGGVDAVLRRMVGGA